ncbi:MAG: GNAT family N-acetyltransferase [Acidobacteriales bacterium]|nr:GNAT family N-acetyltransferase [Terriglobales bacterium]
MTIEFRLVEGARVALDAARILSASWPIPTLHYSQEYVSWQLGFPGPWPAPAVVALDGSTPVGFAASMHRRMRFRAATHDVLVVSFVAVLPRWRNQGVAAGLYRNLLTAVRRFGTPVITFAQATSAGQQVLERAYPAAGYQLCPIGEYPLVGFMAKQNAQRPWRLVAPSEIGPALRKTIDSLSLGENIIWSDPTELQLRHYLHDPRGRYMLLHRGKDGPRAAAWSVCTELVGSRGIDHVLTTDSVWLPVDRPELLRNLVLTIADRWSAGANRPTVVHAPNLSLFRMATLREQGFRQVAVPFHGYLAVPDSAEPFLGATCTNLEVV